MNEDFEIWIGSDPDSEYFWAEIQYKREAVAAITEADKEEDMDIQLFPRRSAAPWHLNLKDFEEALQRAKQGLKDLNSGPPPSRAPEIP